jgi:hypothetical protein
VWFAVIAVSAMPINVEAEKQLFIDRRFIEREKNIALVVNRPRKTGERIMIAEKPWESFIVNAWVTVMEDEGRVRMWYEAYAGDEASDVDARLCYAESPDDIHFTKPELGLVEFRGSKKNNIVFDGKPGWYHGGTVFKDPMAPPDRRYKLIYLGPSSVAGKHAVRGAYSPDGLRWTQYPDAILNVSSDTQSVAFWDEVLKKYVAYVRLWKPMRTVGRSESEDFAKFPAAQEVMRYDDQDPPDSDLYNNAAIKYPYAADVYLTFPSRFYHKADTLDVQLAVSRDGINWTRPDRGKAFIPLGDKGEFDSMTIYASVGLLRRGDELWMYYNGGDVGHNANDPKRVKYGRATSRAVLRLDGYMSVDTTETGGEFTTPPLVFSGDHLELNIDTGARGVCAVELRSDANVPIKAFSAERCDVIQGNSTAYKVTWKNSAALGQFAGKPIRLRFLMKDCKLYAFHFPKGE